MAGIGNYKKGAKFKLRSGNTTPFKEMGSSPMKHQLDRPHVHDPNSPLKDWKWYPHWHGDGRAAENVKKAVKVAEYIPILPGGQSVASLKSNVKKITNVVKPFITTTDKDHPKHGEKVHKDELTGPGAFDFSHKDWTFGGAVMDFFMPSNRYMKSRHLDLHLDTEVKTMQESKDKEEKKGGSRTDDPD